MKIKKRLYKQAEKIAKQGGASSKNKVLIKWIIDVLNEKNASVNELKKLANENFMIRILRKNKQIDTFIRDVLREVEREYKRQKK